MSLGLGFDASALITGHFGTSAKGDPFELRAGPFMGDELRVLSIAGQERVNDLYAYSVTFATEVPAEILSATLFGEPACLTLKAPGFEPRVIQGLVACFEAMGGVPGERNTKRRRYRLQVVPRLWLLKRRRRNRIFQNKSAPEIINAILQGIDVPDEAVHWRIHKDDYPKRPFVYQRGESDYDLFRRVLADAGIFFYFEHASGLLDSLLPGAGQAAGLLTEAAGMVGGAVAGAVDQVAKLTKSVTVLNFGDEAGHTPAVTAGLVSDLATEAIGGGLSAAAGALGNAMGGAAGAKFASGLVDEDPSDTLQFDDGTAHETDTERVYAFALRKRLRTKALRITDHDPQPKKNWVGVAGVDSVKLAPDASLGIAAGFAGGLGGQASLGMGGLAAGFTGAFSGMLNATLAVDVDAPNIKADELREDRYQVDRSVWQDKDPDGRMALELERRRDRYIEATGRSDSRRVGAGYRFKLDGHPIGYLNDEYTITSLTVAGVHPDFASDRTPVYENRFRCIPAKVAPRPRRPRRRPKPGMEIATVVNFIGGDALPSLGANPCGYVRVRFAWDIVDDQGTPRGGLELNDDDLNAVWVPVLQPWAGPGFGAQFIPREGMQVLVGFLDEQTERPVILGCLYSEANRPPWPEGADNQKIGIRSQTRPAKGGYSEISIDDRQEGELVKVRANRDFELEVLRDARTLVQGADSKRVAGGASVDVDGDLTALVGGARKATVRGSDLTKVSGSASSEVEGSLSTTAGGDATHKVKGSCDESVGGEATCTIQGSRVLTVGDDDVTSVGQVHSLTVGAGGQDGAESSTYVWGAYRVGAKKTVTLEAEEAVVLRCGQTELRLTPKLLSLLSEAVQAVGSKTLQLTGKGPTVHLSSDVQVTSAKMSFQSSGALLALGDSAQLTASKVQLGKGSGDSSSATSSDPTKKPFSLTVLDPLHQPLANRTYRLELGGANFQGKTDGSGIITAKVPEGVTSGRCTVWTGDFPEGSRVTYEIQFDAIEPASTLSGAQKRLRNLGLYGGDATGEMDFGTHDALLVFQHMHDVEPTGTLDGPTQSKLAEVHP